MSESLYGLVKKSQEITQEIIENGGELPKDLELALDENEKSLSLKVDGYHHILDRMSFEKEFWKEKKKYIDQIIKALDGAENNLKNRLKDAMRDLDVQELVGNEVRFKLGRSKPKLEIDPDKLPGPLLIEEVTYKPDQDKIRDFISKGEEVPGVRVIESWSLRTYANTKRLKDGK